MQSFPFLLDLLQLGLAFLCFFFKASGVLPLQGALLVGYFVDPGEISGETELDCGREGEVNLGLHEVLWPFVLEGG